MLKSILSIAILIAATSATAQPQSDSGTVRVAIVKVGDLNLASSSAQRVLSHRLAGAVEEACGSYANAAEPYQQMEIDACRAAAMIEARRQIASKLATVRLAASDAR